MPKQRMSPEALERFRKLRKEQRIGQRTKRRNRIRGRAKRLQPKPLRVENPGASPVTTPVPLTNCGICGRKLRAGHAGSLLCKPCHQRDLLDEALDLSTLWLPPTSGELSCAAYDYEEE